MTDPRTALTALITEHSALTGARADRLADKILNHGWTSTAETDGLRVRLYNVHDLWREWQYGERSATDLEPGIAYCADRLGRLLAVREEP